jgi:hypothetical protein
MKYLSSLFSTLLVISTAYAANINADANGNKMTNYDFQPDLSQNYELEIRMKNSTLEEIEDLRCTFIKLDSLHAQFITKIQIQGLKEISHHITLQACERLALFENNNNSYDNSW